MAPPSECDLLDIGLMLTEGFLHWVEAGLCGIFRHEVMFVSLVAEHGTHRCCLFLHHTVMSKHGPHWLCKAFSDMFSPMPFAERNMTEGISGRRPVEPIYQSCTRAKDRLAKSG
jgi:hypothetical protein